MSYGLKVTSYKISDGIEEDNKERCYGNENNKDDFR